MRLFIAFFVVIGGIVLAVTLGVMAIAGPSCPYGSHDRPSGSASVSCKYRPKPTAKQAAAVLDGSAIVNGVAGFKKGEDAGQAVLGVGLNAWGETTFTIPDGKNFVGAPKRRLVSFGPKGGLAPADNAFTRRYKEVSDGREPISLAALRPEKLGAALRRVHEGAPELIFISAAYARAAAVAGDLWTLEYTSTGSSRAVIADVVLEVRPDGSGLCQTGRASVVRRVKACGAGGGPASSGDEMTCIAGAGDPAAIAACSGGGAPAATPTPAPRRKKRQSAKSATSQIECVQNAGTDVDKLRACMEQ
jgi:hypothetical protein